MIGIYKITNLVNNKIYIGQSKNVKARLCQHRNRAFILGTTEYDSPLHKDIRLLCKNKSEYYHFFKEEIVCECSVEELNDLEIHYIKHFNTQNNIYGYNIAAGGQSSAVEPDFLQELVDDLRDTALSNTEIGLKYGLTDQSVSDINVGKCWHDDNLSYPIRKRVKKEVVKKESKYIPAPSAEELLTQIQKYRDFAKVARYYNTTVRILRRWLRNRGLSDLKKDYVKKNEHKTVALKNKMINQYTLDKRLICQYNSVREASRELMGDSSARRHIAEVCEGKRRSAYGYLWSYAN